MRTLFVTACLAAVACASATAAPSGRIASHCSATGDVCYGVFDDRGLIKFQLTLAAKYFTRYRVCVKPPRTAATTCRSFPVRRTGSQFGGVVRLERNFPSRGLGTYRVTWRQGTRALGPALTFSPRTRL